MKKKILLIFVLLLTIIIITGLITSFKDSARVRAGKEPKYTIKIISEEGSKVIYLGLGYKVVRYVGVSPNEPFGLNDNYKYGSWFMKYDNPDVENNQVLFKDEVVKNVTIDIKDVSRSGATLIIKDTNKKPYIYGEWFKIQKKENNDWLDVPVIVKDGYGFNEIGYTVDKNNEVKFVINWKWLYGELPIGEYRILKNVDNKYIGAEFKIIADKSK